MEPPRGDRGEQRLRRLTDQEDGDAVGALPEKSCSLGETTDEEGFKSLMTIRSEEAGGDAGDTMG